MYPLNIFQVRLSMQDWFASVCLPRLLKYYFAKKRVQHCGNLFIYLGEPLDVVIIVALKSSLLTTCLLTIT